MANLACREATEPAPERIETHWGQQEWEHTRNGDNFERGGECQPGEYLQPLIIMVEFAAGLPNDLENTVLWEELLDRMEHNRRDHPNDMNEPRMAAYLRARRSPWKAGPAETCFALADQDSGECFPH